MSFGVVAAVGAAAVGSAISANGAKSAAKTQAAATDRASEIQERQYEQIRSDLAPYRDLGTGASNKLAQYLGLGTGAPAPTRRSLSEIRAQLASQQGAKAPANSFSGGAQGGISDGVTQDAGGLIYWFNGVPHRQTYQGGNAAESGPTFEPIAGMQPMGAAAAYTSGGAGSLDAEAQRLYDQEQAEYARWQQEQNAAAQDPIYGSLLKNFTGEDLQNEPGYQFGLSEGLKAGDRAAASRGNFFSGGALKAATRFGNDYASTKYGDAFNRDAANKTRIYNFLSGATSTGQNAAAQTGNAGSNMANQVGANTTAMGNANAASQIAQGNAWSGGINNAVNSYQQNELMNKIMKGNSGWGIAGGRGYTVPDYSGAEY